MLVLLLVLVLVGARVVVFGVVVSVVGFLGGSCGPWDSPAPTMAMPETATEEKRKVVMPPRTGEGMETRAAAVLAKMPAMMRKMLGRGLAVCLGFWSMILGESCLGPKV